MFPNTKYAFFLELRMEWFVRATVGDTKDPGSSLFRRFQASFTSLESGYTRENLRRLDLSKEPEWVQELYTSEVFPRDEYHESLGWLIWHLGGEPDDFFPLKMPGADNSCRWMAKTIYYPKILACSFLFPLTTQELQNARDITAFTCLFYGRAWFQAPLAARAARTDLTFMSQMLRYYK